LKNIDRIPFPLQEKLAMTFQHHAYYPIGDMKQKTCSVSVIATAQNNIVGPGAEEHFVAALAEALPWHSIRIPPLRERREDLPFIAEAIIEKYSLGLYDEQELLALYDYFDTQEFPENLRDLKRILFFLGAKRRAET
jgi:DNA-binding NtrC family response regulator